MGPEKYQEYQDGHTPPFHHDVSNYADMRREVFRYPSLYFYCFSNQVGTVDFRPLGESVTKRSVHDTNATLWGPSLRME